MENKKTRIASKSKFVLENLGGWCYSLTGDKRSRSYGFYQQHEQVFTHLSRTGGHKVTVSELHRWVNSLIFSDKLSEGVSVTPSCPLIFNHKGTSYVLYHFFPDRYCTVFPHFVGLVNTSTGFAVVMDTLAFSKLFTHLAPCYANSGGSPAKEYVRADEESYSAFEASFDTDFSDIIVNKYNAYVLKEAKKQLPFAQPFIKAFLIDPLTQKNRIESMKKEGPAWMNKDKEDDS